MAKSNLLVVIQNGNCIAAYSIYSDTAARDIQEALFVKLGKRDDLRLQVIEVNDPPCKGGYIDSVVADIFNKIGLIF